MSDNIPFDIQVDVIKRLPVKSLIQFRPVSKAWKSLIDSSRFIKHYSSQQQHLLIKYYDDDDSVDAKYVSVVDDHTFPEQKVPMTVPRLVNWRKYYRLVVGCSHGLLCLFGRCSGGGHMALLWNPSIRKAVAVEVPNVASSGKYRTVLGFGVCRETRDPKIIKLTYIHSWEDMESISCIPRQVEVFTLSTGAWRSPYSNDLPHETITFEDNISVVVDGVLYWLALAYVNEYLFYYNLIISFDMTTEEFKEVKLPEHLPYGVYYQPGACDLTLSKLRGSLVVLEAYGEANNRVSVVWMMEDGVSKSFTKLFTINANVNLPRALIKGFRKSGEPIVAVKDDDIDKLVVYDPYAKRIDDTVFDGIECSFYVYPYMETLLLLDQPDLIVHNDVSKRRAKNKGFLKHKG